MTDTLRSAAHDESRIKDRVGTGSARGAGISALYSIRKEVEGLFAKYEDDLDEARLLAEGVAAAIETSGAFIERHTSAICPDCRKVCCINRHAYHELADIICICALGERPPLYSRETADTEPCQFLGERGCSIRRILRPHRCNWYFCDTLLGHIQTVSAREYRRFVADLRDINEKRGCLVNAFTNVVKAAGFDYGYLRRAADEIFFM